MAVKSRRFEAQVEEVVASFDFERVLSVMNWLGWTWANLGRTPSRAELEAEARRLLRELGSSPGSWAQAGCARATRTTGR